MCTFLSFFVVAALSTPHFDFLLSSEIERICSFFQDAGLSRYEPIELQTSNLEQKRWSQNWTSGFAALTGKEGKTVGRGTDAELSPLSLSHLPRASLLHRSMISGYILYS